MFSWFDLAWPWIGLVGAAVLAVLLFATPLLRSDAALPRRRDPRWLGFLAMAVYMVHQVEEYGIAANGVAHAFPDGLCTLLGQPAYPACAIPPVFFLAVNLPLVWIAAPVAAVLAPRIPLLGMVLWGVIAANAVVHIAPAIATLSYDPGLLTAVLLFVPLSIWVLSALRPRRGLIPVLVAGVLMHVVLGGSLMLFLHAGLPAWALVALQPLALVVAYGIAFIAGRRRPGARSAAG